MGEWEPVDVMPLMKLNANQFADDAAPVPQVMTGLDCDQKVKGDPSGTGRDESQLQRAGERAKWCAPRVGVVLRGCSQLAGWNLGLRCRFHFQIEFCVSRFV